jgi:hypothetical protein
MRIDTNMLAGVTDKDTIMKMLLRPNVSHTHTWLNINGDHKVLIVRVDMLDAKEQNYLIEIWRINAENPNIGFQHFDRHAGMPFDDLIHTPINGWLYPDRAAMMADLMQFIDANVHSS